MKVRLLDGVARVIAATGQVVEPGDEVEVDDELGKSLIEQVDVWGKAPRAAKAEKE